MPERKAKGKRRHRRGEGSTYAVNDGGWMAALPLGYDRKTGKRRSIRRRAPDQASAERALQRLKREYGKDLCFWGAGVDTQGVLPKGSVEDVKKNVAERIKAFSPGGGFIFGAVHNIQDDVPAENIIAMLKAFDELKHYH